MPQSTQRSSKYSRSIIRHASITNAIRRRTALIPQTLATDPRIITLVTRRAHMLLRHAVLYRRRSRHKNKEKASRLEKRDTQRRQVLAERIQVLERKLLNRIGNATHHPELFSSDTDSQRVQLIDAWQKLRRRTIRWAPIGHQTVLATLSRTRTHQRHKLAEQIQDLEHMWLSALTLAIHPHDPLPPRRVVNASWFRL